MGKNKACLYNFWMADRVLSVETALLFRFHICNTIGGIETLIF